jgi:subtilase family serine protease
MPRSAAGSYEASATQVWMAVRQQAAQRFVNASSTPGSKTFRRFLSPDAYMKRFGPSAGQVKAVESYLRAERFTHVQASINDDYVSGVAPASDHRPLKIPASLSRDVLAVTGRNDAQVKANIAAARSAAAAAASPTATATNAKALGCSRYWGQKTQTISPAFDGVSEATLPVCGYSAHEIRDAYGLASSDTGKGETIALIQIGGPIAMRQTLTDWARRNGLPTPRPGQYREEAVNGGAKNNACQNIGPTEAGTDAQGAYATAPGANLLMVDGDDCDQNDQGSQALLDAMLAPLTGHGLRPSASIESVSWNIAATEAGGLRTLVKVSHVIALRAAAEGVSLLIASGDSLSIRNPASDPDVTAVGGTTLGLGANGQRLFQTGWSTRLGERTGTSGTWTDLGVQAGSGGGVSDLYPEPSYQRGVVPSAMARTKTGQAGRVVPDISADADDSTGMLIGQINPKTGRYGTTIGAGTSMATPLVAGIVADAEQGRPGSFGFLNPLLYSLAGTPAITDILPLAQSAPAVDRAYYTTAVTYFHGKYAPGYQIGVTASPASAARAIAPGYDTVTGLGTPNGSSFINALRSGK